MNKVKEDVFRNLSVHARTVIENSINELGTKKISNSEIQNNIQFIISLI